MSETHRESARRIVEEGVDIRARIHEITSRALSGGGLDAGEVKAAVRDTIEGVKEGLANSLPDRQSEGRESTLRQVFDGMSEAVAAAADAARHTVEHAAERGREFSTTELGAMWSKLSSLEQSFLDSVQHAADELGEHARAQLHDIAGEARRAGTRIGPAAKSAMEAVQGKMGETAREALNTGVRAVQTIVGETVMAVSGLLSGVGDALKKRAKQSKADAKRSSGARKKKGKTAPRASRKSTTGKSPAAKKSGKSVTKKSGTKRSRSMVAKKSGSSRSKASKSSRKSRGKR